MANPVSEALVAGFKCGESVSMEGIGALWTRKMEARKATQTWRLWERHEQERDPPDMGVKTREGAWHRLPTEIRNNFEGHAC